MEETMGPLAYVLISNTADRMLLCILGLAISVYSLHIEVQHEKNPHYRAACDFNQHMSCSRVLTSRFSRGFGVVAKLLGPDHWLNARNCNMGIFFYLAHMAVALLVSPAVSVSILLAMSVSGVLLCVYLAYILFFILRDLCVVCVTAYVISGLLLYINYAAYAGWTA